MRSLDYTPLHRSTVGFDRLFDTLDKGVRSDWPPYNIEKTGEHSYRITMAIAGFTREEVDLTQHGPELIVTGDKNPEPDESQILHRGLASGNFRQVFKLADHVKVSSATLANGLLSVDLVREIPEQLKPRSIAIGSGQSLASPAADATEEQGSQDPAPGRKAA